MCLGPVRLQGWFVLEHEIINLKTFYHVQTKMQIVLPQQVHLQ